MMGFGNALHQLDRIQTSLCTSLQTDNNINTSSLNLCRPDALPDAQSAVSNKALKAVCREFWRSDLYASL